MLSFGSTLRNAGVVAIWSVTIGSSALAGQKVADESSQRHVLHAATITAEPPRIPSFSADSASAAAVVAALFAAAERGDLSALDTLYAGDSLTVVEGAGINRTWADYRDHHLGPELKEMKNLRYRPSEIEVHVRGALAWAIFRYTLRADAEGQPADIVGRGTAILEKRGNRWVVRHTQTSGRARRPTDPPPG
jgi:ketosteroid isomerase-like protein